MRIVTATAALLACGIVTMSAQVPTSGLTRLLQADLARWPAKAGVYVKQLTTGEEAAVAADEAFNFLPPGYGTAHKTGDGPPIIANDVGMVYARSGTIVMAFFTAENRGLFQDLEDQIGRATRLVVDYFDGRVAIPQ
jgi:beta-lactamase class A